MIKTYISALLVVLLASAQYVAHAQQSMDDVFAQMDTADDADQPDGTSTSSANDTSPADVELAGREPSGMLDSLYGKGVSQYKDGNYDEAISIFNAVLAIDKYHDGAVTYKKRAAERVDVRESKKQRGGRVKAFADVNAAWNPEPKTLGDVAELDVTAGMDFDQQAGEQMVARLKAITIPVLDVAEATIEEVVQFFAETSRGQDRAGEDVDILLVGMETATAENNITISVDDISLYEALQYVVEMASLKFEVKQNLVIIMPANYVPASKMVMKSYDIIPEVGADLESAADDGGGAADLFDSSSSGDSASGPADVSGFFSIVEFPEGSSAFYQSRFHKLFVRNTPKNLKAVEAVLGDLAEKAIARRSQQVEIETKFVEFNEGALEELGFDWTVYGSGSVAGFEMPKGTYFQGANGYEDSFGIAPSSGFANGDPVFDDTLYTDPVSGQQVIEPNPGQAQNLFGAAQRNNTKAYQPVLTGVLATMGGTPGEMAFTDGNVDLRITAMEQEGTADVLSAPRVTTKSGSEALIRVAETHRYPQDYDVETGQRTGPIIRPQDWNDFDMGVALKVTPVVDSETGTIALDLFPEIMVFKGYDDYLVGYNAYDAGGNNSSAGGGDGAPLLVKMASFERRSVETQVIVADGSTVVMGGLIDERTETFRDQVPLLGDIPYLGRLFRTEGSRIAKRNLTIFLKASRVDNRGMTHADRELALQ